MSILYRCYAQEMELAKGSLPVPAYALPIRQIDVHKSESDYLTSRRAVIGVLLQFHLSGLQDWPQLFWRHRRAVHVWTNHFAVHIFGKRMAGVFMVNGMDGVDFCISNATEESLTAESADLEEGCSGAYRIL